MPPEAGAAGPLPVGTGSVLQPRGSLPRFDRVERAAHWSTALLFGVLMATGAVLYAGPFSELFGRRELFRQVHTIAGILLPVPLVLALAGRWGRNLRSDLGRLNRWSRADARWFRRRRHHRVALASSGSCIDGRQSRRRRGAGVGRLDLGKFNPGQKLNATFLGAAIVVMFATGLMLRWPDPFSNDWRTGATFVHDWFAIGVWLAVSGHILFALRDPTALHGMTHGTVTRSWARLERPAWFREVTDPESFGVSEQPQRFLSDAKTPDRDIEHPG